MAEADKCLDSIDLAPGLKETQKTLVRDNLTGIVLSALADAKHSAELDVSNPYFLVPYTVACIQLGEAWANLGQGKRYSALMSEYAKRRVAIDPKQQEKQLIFECWTTWQKEPSRYASSLAQAEAELILAVEKVKRLRGGKKK